MSNSKVIHMEMTLNGDYVGVVHGGDGDDFMSFTLNWDSKQLRLFHPEVFVPTLYQYNHYHKDVKNSIKEIINNDKPNITHCDYCMGKGRTVDSSTCRTCHGTGVR